MSFSPGQYLDSFYNFAHHLDQAVPSTLKLERMSALLQSLGNPQLFIRCVHIAGSKGKGSTAALTASVLQTAGYRVGLYTSPHLHALPERIRVLPPGGKAAGDFCGSIPAEALAGLLEELKPKLEEMRCTPEYGNLTYFEVLTAAAFCYFKQCGVDIAVLEAGLGGRLDATNCCEPLACGLTTICLEHTRILGRTLAQIASEKSAIIKNVPGKLRAVSAPQDPLALAVIRKRCQETGVPLRVAGEDLTYGVVEQSLAGQVVRIHGRSGAYDLPMSLVGEHQAVNAAVAVGLLEEIQEQGLTIPRSAFVQGALQTRVPGRFEVVHQRPVVILDAAHTPAAFQRLAATLQAVCSKRKLTLVLGISRDKDRAGAVRELSGRAERVILTRSRHPRAAELRLQDWPGKDKRDVLETTHVAAALRQALDRTCPDDVILVTGSFFVVAEARDLLTEQQGEKVL